MLQVGRLRVSDLMRLLNFSVYLILPASNRNEYQKKEKLFIGSKARPTLKADILTDTFEPIVYIMWEPQHLTTL
jgi:hypothetical protein